MLLTIDLPTDTPRFQFRTRLDGTDYVLLFDYSGREDRWYVSIKASDETPILSGIKVVCGVPLLRNCVDSRRPAGRLIFLDLTDTEAEAPGFADLGRRVRLYYEEFVPSISAPLIYSKKDIV